MSAHWRIYYGDGSTYDDSDGSAWDAPARDVQAVVVSDENHGWYINRLNDYYWYEPDSDEWTGGDIFGLWDYLCRPGTKKVVFGRTIGTQEYRQILHRAMHDPALPKKSGWRPHERRD